jgi:hypothetical protein
LPKKTALEEWRKDRREPSAFITLHKIEDFHTWELSVEVQAINQRVKNVFDPAYVPSTPEEVELFDVQKNYIRSVLTKFLFSTRVLLLFEKWEEYRTRRKCLRNCRMRLSTRPHHASKPEA